MWNLFHTHHLHFLLIYFHLYCCRSHCCVFKYSPHSVQFYICYWICVSKAVCWWWGLQADVESRGIQGANSQPQWGEVKTLYVQRAPVRTDLNLYSLTVKTLPAPQIPPPPVDWPASQNRLITPLIMFHIRSSNLRLSHVFALYWQQTINHLDNGGIFKCHDSQWGEGFLWFLSDLFIFGCNGRLMMTSHTVSVPPHLLQFKHLEYKPPSLATVDAANELHSFLWFDQHIMLMGNTTNSH